MPNNPFDSFHDIVAEAKAEREQLDRLLTFSTPRERLLVAAIGVLLAALAGWLVVGSVPRVIALQGALVEPGDFQSGSTRSLQAVVWIEPDVATHLYAGLPVKVLVPVSGGRREALDGTVAAAPVAGAGAEFAPPLPVSALPIDISLNDDLDFASLTGRECRIVFEIGRQPPVALFGMGRS